MSVEFSPDGRYVLAGRGGGTIQLFDAKSGNEIRRFEGHTRVVHSVHFLPDGRHIISGSEDKTIRLRDADSGGEVARIETDNHVTHPLCVSPDGRYVASGGGQYRTVDGEYKKDGDYAIRLWRLSESVWPKDKEDEDN